jgi:hypothetical protein
MIWVCDSGNLQFVKYIYSIGGLFSGISICLACRKGYVDIVRFIYNSEKDIDISYHYIIDENDNIENEVDLMKELMKCAVISGNIEMVIYIHSIGGIYTIEAISIASEKGYIDIIKYLYTNNKLFFENDIKNTLPLPIFQPITRFMIPNIIILSAIYNEQLEMVKYLYSIGYTAKNKHILNNTTVQSWFLSLNSVFFHSDSIHILDYYTSKTYFHHTVKLKSLGMSKNLEYIKYIISIGGEIDNIDLKDAKANKNHLIIKYIYDELIKQGQLLMKQKRDDMIKEYSIYKSQLQQILDA